MVSSRKQESMHVLLPSFLTQTILKHKCLKRHSKVQRDGSPVWYPWTQRLLGCSHRRSPPTALNLLVFQAGAGAVARLFAPHSSHLATPHCPFQGRAILLLALSSLDKYHGFSLMFALYYNIFVLQHPVLMICISLWLGYKFPLNLRNSLSFLAV